MSAAISNCDRDEDYFYLHRDHIDQLLSWVSIGAITTDEHGNAIRISQAAAKKFGLYHPSTWYGALGELLDEASLPAFRAYLENIGKNETVQNCTVRSKRNAHHRIEFTGKRRRAEGNRIYIDHVVVESVRAIESVPANVLNRSLPVLNSEFPMRVYPCAYIGAVDRQDCICTQFIAAHTSGPAARIDEELRLVFANESFLSCFDVAKNEEPRPSLKDLVPPPLFAKLMECLSELGDVKSVSTFEHAIFASNGAKRIFRFQITLDPSKTGAKNRGFYLIGNDITLNRRAASSRIDFTQPFESVSETYPGKVARVDHRCRIEFVNSEFADYLGSDVSQLLGKSIRSFSQCSLLERAVEFLPELQRGRSAAVELNFDDPYFKRFRSVLLSLVPFLGDKSQFAGFWIFATDISKQKCTLGMLQTEFESIQTVLNAIDAPIARFDVDERYTYVNRFYPRFYNTCSDNILGKEIVNVIGEARYELIEHHIQSVLRGRNVCVEFRNTSAQGEHIAVVLFFAPEFGKDGHVSGFYLLGHDVTQIKHMELLIQSNFLRAKSQHRHLHAGTCIHDVREKRTEWSKEIFGFFGLSPESRPVPFPEILRYLEPECMHSFRDAYLRAIQEGKPFSIRIMVNRESQPSIVLRVEGHAILDVLGNVIELYGTMFDITVEMQQQKVLEEARNAAETANVAKTTFLANMSHELRTPLTSILGFSEILISQDADALSELERQQMLNSIKASGEHLLALVNDILDTSRIEADHITTRSELVSLPDLFCEVRDMIRVLSDRAGLAFILESVTDIPSYIQSDKKCLRQMLVNLLGNAVKFTLKGHIALRIQWDAETANLHMFVEDSGIGILPEQQERIFNPFEQVDNSHTRNFGGTGLGLYISKRIATLLGGELTIEQSRPELGTIFKLSIPCVVPPRTELVRFSEGPISRRILRRNSPKTGGQLEGKILVAEDGIDNQKLIRHILESAGAIVDVADNGETALASFQNAMESGTPYDLIITDIQMPIMDGLELARTIRRVCTSVPIIALTAHAFEEHVQSCFSNGCSDFGTKPIAKKSLIELCDKWIRRT